VSPDLPGVMEAAGLSERAQFLFAFIACFTDRKGRLADNPRYLKRELFPRLRDDEVAALIDELAAAVDDQDVPFLYRYKVMGSNFIFIPSFVCSQNPHKYEGPSEIPEQPETCTYYVAVKGEGPTKWAPVVHSASTVHALGEHSAHTVQAPVTHSASTVQLNGAVSTETVDIPSESTVHAQCEHSAGTVRAPVTHPARPAVTGNRNTDTGINHHHQSVPVGGNDDGLALSRLSEGILASIRKIPKFAEAVPSLDEVRPLAEFLLREAPTEAVVFDQLRKFETFNSHGPGAMQGDANWAKTLGLWMNKHVPRWRQLRKDVLLSRLRAGPKAADIEWRTVGDLAQDFVPGTDRRFVRGEWEDGIRAEILAIDSVLTAVKGGGLSRERGENPVITDVADGDLAVVEVADSEVKQA